MGKSTANRKKVSFAMLLVTIGIVYGDIGTSPMYVMKSIIEGNGGLAQTSQELVIGSLSLVIWTITLLTTIKHVLIAMRANNHGEGGIFALYALVVLVVFGAIEAVFFVSSLGKFIHGGYVAVIMALILFFIMLVWHRGTQLERQYCVPLHFADYVQPLGELHDEPEIPRLTHNLVYLDNGRDFESIDRDILYSILDKDAKRASAYWFISATVHDEPSVMRYEVETYGTDYIFRVRLHLGFKDHQRVNVYLRQIVSDLIESGELPPQNRKHSIYGKSDVGNFKFCILHKVVPPKAGLSSMDEMVLNVKYAIRHIAGSKAQWYGLDTSSLIAERVPLLVNQSGRSTRRIERMEHEKAYI